MDKKTYVTPLMDIIKLSVDRSLLVPLSAESENWGDVIQGRDDSYGQANGDGNETYWN